MSGCPKCKRDGVYISNRTTPKSGPLKLDGVTYHERKGDVYYHLDDE